MKLLKSKVGLTLSLLYLFGSVYLIASQGLFGESFIAVVLGLPWSFFMAYFSKFFPIKLENPLFLLFVCVWILTPIIVNIICLYWIGVGIQKLARRYASTTHQS